MARPVYINLSRAIDDAGYYRRQAEFAALVGMGVSTLSARLHGAGQNGDWRKHEVVAICRALHLTRSQMAALFFPELPE